MIKSGLEKIIDEKIADKMYDDPAGVSGRRRMYELYDLYGKPGHDGRDGRRHAAGGLCRVGRTAL